MYPKNTVNILLKIEVFNCTRSNLTNNKAMNKETIKLVQSRLDIPKKGVVSEENSVYYYGSLWEKHS